MFYKVPCHHAYKHDLVFYKFIDIYLTVIILNTIPVESRITRAVARSLGICTTNILATHSSMFKITWCVMQFDSIVEWGAAERKILRSIFCGTKYLWLVGMRLQLQRSRSVIEIEMGTKLKGGGFSYFLFILNKRQYPGLRKRAWKLKLHPQSLFSPTMGHI